jgi:hypothetical protein
MQTGNIVRLGLVLLPIGLCDGCLGPRHPHATGRPNMDFGDMNLMDLAVEGRAALLVGVVERVAGPAPLDEETQTGTLQFHVTRVLTPQRWHGPAELELRFAQFTEPHLRARMGAGWNGVDIRSGAHLLIALTDIPAKPESATTHPPLSALAVAELKSDDDPLVRAVQQVLTIEATADTRRRMDLIRQGLESDLRFLSEYCHYAIGRLKRIPRQDATTMELALFQDTQRSAQHRLSAEAVLEMELWKPEDASDTLNHRILEAFFNAAPTGDAEFRKTTALGIYNMLFTDAPENPSEQDGYRRQLMSAVQLTDRNAVLSALQDAEKDPNVSAEVGAVRRLVAQR